MKKILLCVLVLQAVISKAQPIIQWQKNYGGSALDQSFRSCTTSDKGFALIGKTFSFNGNVTGNHGGDDFWLIKTDSLGNLQWQKTYGGAGDDRGYSVYQTSDGGYIMTGLTQSTNGDVTSNHGAMDIWVVKTDATGTIQWQKTYGGTNQEWGTSVLEISGTRYMVYGVTNTANNGDVTSNHGQTDEWLLQLDAVGNIIWQKCYGGTGADGSNAFDINGNALSKTSDGGYLVAGGSTSVDGDVTGHHVGNPMPIGGDYDVWVMKLDSTGNIQWEKSLGGSELDKSFGGFETAGGEHIVCGQTASVDGDVTGHVQAPGATSASANAWVVKIDASGNLIWQNNLGLGFAYNASGTNDGGCIVAHNTKVIKLDVAGNIQWQKKLNLITRSVWQTADNGYFAGGYNTVGAGSANQYQLTKLAPISGYIIHGNIYEDLNHNCVRDTNEIGIPGREVIAMPGNYYATTDDNGDYTLFVDSGNYVISQVNAPYYIQACPSASATYTANIFSAAPNSYGNDFGDTLSMHCADLKVNIGTYYLRRCFKNTFNVSYVNSGAVMATNVTITVNFDSLIIPLSSTLPWTQNGNSYTFTIDTLRPGQFGSFSITDSVSCGALIGVHSACVFASIHSPVAECDTINNCSHDCHIIVGSCDPNAKEVSVGNVPSDVQQNILATDTLSYTIRFQNTGTDTAFTVVVRDTLPSYVDPATVEPGASSHPYSFRVYGQGILEWTFDNINLPDSSANEVASHGFLKFTVRQKPGNTPGTDINNTAAIWFDYNENVNTNKSVASIPNNTTIVHKVAIETAKIFPNPFDHEATLKISNEVKIENAQLKLFDIIGKEVRSVGGINSNEIKIERGNLNPGVYFYQLKNGQRLLTSGKMIVL